jgi:error-prone DNA polymerase
MGFYNLETLKEDAKRHGIRILNPDINKSLEKCVIENGTLRLGFLAVTGLGEATAKEIMEGRKKRGFFTSIGDFLENTGVIEQIACNLAGAGAFGGLELNRRNVKWEIGLRYRPINSQIVLPLTVSQDMVDLVKPTDWENMKEEYQVLGLFPSGHIMARLRPQFKLKMLRSVDIEKMADGADVITAGLVIRRQRPHGKVVFMTLEDEFGHIPLMVFPQICEKNEHKFRSPFIVIKGKVSKREGTHNLIVTAVKPFTVLDKIPQSKDWG